ncbi:MAG: Fur family transcriptional regulator [Patescibacteria group bacterium]
MDDSTGTINKLRANGGRVTPVRRALLQILSSNKQPGSPRQLLAQLKKKGFDANKTTVYRQLEMMHGAGIISEINLSDGVKRYELADSGHHHHLICLRCARIDDVVLPAGLEPRVEIAKMIKRVKKFAVERHSLEFFGVCARCRE